MPELYPEAVKEETEEEADRRRKRQWLLLLLFLFRTLEDDLHRVGAAYAAGEITAQEFGDDVYAYLPVAHAQAVYIGRRYAGVVGPLDADDMLTGRAVAEDQEQYLQGFVDDLQGGKYLLPQEDNPTLTKVNLKAIQARLTLYAMAVAGTANRSWVDSLPDDTLFWWRDVKDQAECKDCRRNALQSPFTKESLPSVPGDGGTACLQKCRCSLITDQEEESFDLRALFDGEGWA